jgi:hypothetical protein
MACNACGHPNDSHQYATSSLYYCDQCKALESHISFTQEAPQKSGNVSDLFK